MAKLLLTVTALVEVPDEQVGSLLSGEADAPYQLVTDNPETHRISSVEFIHDEDDELTPSR